jgi:hypothetical protein
MRQLDEEPVKLVKVTAVRAPDPETKKEARFVAIVLEFRRDLTVRDIDWTAPESRPPYWFSFEDAEGVVLRRDMATYDSVLVGLQGRRVRMVLKVPEGELAARVKKVIVDPRPYGVNY